MIRKIIHIDEEKCDGCGLCASACHEGAIDIIDGKAKLVREHFCDGLGDCLPGCPTGAITFEEREAPEYDEKAVQEAKEKKRTDKDITDKDQNKTDGNKADDNKADEKIRVHEVAKMDGEKNMDEVRHLDEKDHMEPVKHGGGCPGSRVAQFKTSQEEVPAYTGRPVSRLGQWPCQLKLVPTQAPFFDGAKLLIAADCTAYAYAGMHEEFMKGKVTVIGCPKLDAVDYTEKLTAIIRDNDIKSVTIVRMTVPCCGGLQRAAENALKASGKFIPWQVVTISTDGRLVD